MKLLLELKLLLCGYILLLGSTLVQGQAPGDEDTPTCSLQGRGDNVKVLLDSYHYADLIGANEPWATTGTWMNFIGGQCSRETMSCSRSTDPQNNWLFTQYISKTPASGETVNYQVEIQLEIQYSFSSCRSSGNPGGTPCASGEGAAGQQFGVYHYILNSPTPSVRTDTNQYTLVGNIQDSSINRGQTQTLSFTLSADQGGFYIGFRDQGTCVTLERLSVYRYNCPKQRYGLVTFPETSAPASGEVDRTAVCAANAMSTSNTLRCSSEGVWSGNATCECSSAFRRVEDECQGCGEGMFLNGNGGTCLPCPPNSESTAIATEVCPCILGFYRDNVPLNLEGPEVGCTTGPSAPVNVECSVFDSTSITLQWQPPIRDGGRSDVFYRVKNRDLSSVNFTIQTTSATTFVLTSLNPFSTYDVIVFTENGVTDQSVNGEVRSVELSCMTAEALPGKPAETNVVGSFVVWQPPTQPNGIITGYDIRVNIAGSNSTIIHLGPTDFLHEIVEDELPGKADEGTVEIRAVNAVGNGEWSEEKTFFTKCIPCPPPSGVPLEPENFNLIEKRFLTWDPPLNTGGFLTGYRVRIYKNNNPMDPDKIAMTVQPNQTFYVLQDGELPSTRPLTIQVAAINNFNVRREWATIRLD